MKAFLSAVMRKLALSMVVVLSGCSGESVSDVSDWVSAQKAIEPRATFAAPAPAKFVAEPYDESATPDPFSAQKLLLVLKREAAQSAAGSELVARELKRRKEPMELYPLDNMVYTGMLVKDKQPVALVKVDKQLFQVKTGDHIGSNFGRVIKVSDAEVVLREVVQDATGDWIERKATLQLQENAR
jgi:type IV pilus assembly protein PilP